MIAVLSLFRTGHTLLSYLVTLQSHQGVLAYCRCSIVSSQVVLVLAVLTAASALSNLRFGQVLTSGTVAALVQPSASPHS